jgi:ferredoxin/pyruvate-formate lyase-activating enzyme
VDSTDIRTVQYRGLSQLNEALASLWPKPPQGDVVVLASLVGPQGEGGDRRVEPQLLRGIVAYLEKQATSVSILAHPLDLEDSSTFEATVEQLRGAGIEVITESASENVNIDGELIQRASLLKPFVEAQHRVVVGRAASHHTRQFTGGVLEVAGAFEPTARQTLFEKLTGDGWLSEALAEVTAVYPIDLALVDLGGYESLLAGGSDPFALDKTVLSLLETRTVTDAREKLPPKLGHYPTVDATLCTECGSCAELCPTHAVTVQKGAGTVSFDYNPCLRCGVCIAACPDFALTEALNPMAARLVKPSGLEVLSLPTSKEVGERVPVAAAMALGAAAIEAPPRKPAWLDAYTPPSRFELQRNRERDPEPYNPRTVLPADGKIRLIIPPTWGIRGNRSALGVAYLAGLLVDEGFNPIVVDLAYELRIHDPALNEGLEETSNPDPNGGFYGPRMPLILQVVDPKAFGEECPDLAKQVHAAAREDARRIADPSALFGLTVADSSVTYSFALGAALKRLGCRVIFGGPTMSHQPTAELALRAGACDAVVMGEGEAAIVRLAESHRDGTWEVMDPSGIPGLGIINEGAFRLTPNGRNRALDAIPFPDWRGQLIPPDFIPILAARGCVTRCSFCSEQTISPKFAQRSVENVLEEMEYLHKTFGYETFEFNDDLLNGNMKWLRAFCEALIELGSPYDWQGLCRPHKLTREQLQLMRDAGCVQISYGVQHFSWRMLKIMGRREAPDPVKTILRDTLELGMQSYVDIILGHPGETEEDVEITLASIRELMTEFPNIDININPYNHIYGAATDVSPERFDVEIQRFETELPASFAELQKVAERFVIWAKQTPGPETVVDRVNRLAWTVFQVRRPTKIPILNEELPFCNDNCLHCGVADIMKTANVVGFDQIARSLAKLAPLSGGRVMYAVSELTIRPDFLKIMRASRRAGMNTVAVVTNGRMFSYPEFTERAVRAGMTHALVSLYGPTPRTHHAITRTPGSFEQTVKGIEELRKYPQVTLMTNSVITKKNYRYLPQLVEMLAGLGVQNVNLSFVQIIGAAATYQKALIPRIKDVLPHLRQAVDLGVGLGLRVGIGGLPYCVLKGYEHHFGVDDLTYIENSDQGQDNITSRSPYAKADACTRCAYNAVCLGMQDEYLRQYGEEELEPYHGRRLVRRPESDIVRAMFPEFHIRDTSPLSGLESRSTSEPVGETVATTALSMGRR